MSPVRGLSPCFSGVTAARTVHYIQAVGFCLSWHPCMCFTSDTFPCARQMLLRDRKVFVLLSVFCLLYCKSLCDMNVLARVVTQSGSRSSAKPLLQQLHWLPVKERIKYNLALLAYKFQTATAFDYLCCLLQPHHNNRSLGSSSAPRFVVPYGFSPLVL